MPEMEALKGPLPLLPQLSIQGGGGSGDIVDSQWLSRPGSGTPLLLLLSKGRLLGVNVDAQLLRGLPHHLKPVKHLL